MIDWDSDYLVNYGRRDRESGDRLEAEYHPERPRGVVVVAAVLILACLAHIAIALIALGHLSDLDYLYSQRMIDAAREVLWADIVLVPPVLILVFGLFSDRDWARVGLISYLASNGVASLFGLLAHPWHVISMAVDLVIAGYLLRDDVCAAYPDERGRGVAVAGGIVPVVAQALITFMLLGSLS